MLVIDNKAKKFAKRLNQALDLREYPPFGRGRVNYIQEVFNISRSGANKWLHGKSIPHPKARRLIAEKLGISLIWLETGNGEPTKIETKQYSPESSTKKIPLLTLAEACVMGANYPLTSEHNIIITRNISEFGFAIELVGKSMLPKFDEGSILIVDPKEKIADGDFVIAKSDIFPEAVCRQIIFGADGKYLIALNPKFQPMKLSNPSGLLGKIIEVRTNL